MILLMPTTSKTNHYTIDIGELSVQVTRKAIKHCYLRVNAQTGQVRLSAPRRISEQQIKQFIYEKAEWIARHQQRIVATPKVPDYQYISGEIHGLWGEDYRLNVIETSGRHHVVRENDELHLFVRRNTHRVNRKKALMTWYAQQLDSEITRLSAKWQPIMQQSLNSWQVRQMKSRWGSCHIQRRHIVLALALIHYPKTCLEYVFVHEMVHLYERYHNARFYALMDHYLPQWRERKALLNS